MARALRLTKAERELLRTWLPTLLLVKSDARSRDSLLSKLSASEEAPAGVDVGPLERALVAAARGKVLALEGGHAVASKRAAGLKMTEADCTMVGHWMACQGWLTTPMTILDVQNKWYQWLPKARATQPPPALGPGLGTDADNGRGAAPAGQAYSRRRPPPGLR